MRTASIPLGTAGRLWVSAEAGLVTVSHQPFWQQRLTPGEARRLAEALLEAAGD